MHSVMFSTDLPYDHLQRAIDTMRRMGFAVVKVALEIKDERAMVRLGYQASSHLSPATLHHRLAEMPGVFDVKSFEGARNVPMTQASHTGAHVKGVP